VLVGGATGVGGVGVPLMCDWDWVNVTRTAGVTYWSTGGAWTAVVASGSTGRNLSVKQSVPGHGGPGRAYQTHK